MQTHDFFGGSRRTGNLSWPHLEHVAVYVLPWPGHPHLGQPCIFIALVRLVSLAESELLGKEEEAEEQALQVLAPLPPQAGSLR